MIKLPTTRELIEKEIKHRLKILKMSKRQAGFSLGYSEAGFRYICKQLEIDSSYIPRISNDGARKIYKRNNSKKD